MMLLLSLSLSSCLSDWNLSNGLEGFQDRRSSVVYWCDRSNSFNRWKCRYPSRRTKTWSHFAIASNWSTQHHLHRRTRETSTSKDRFARSSNNAGSLLLAATRQIFSIIRISLWYSERCSPSWSAILVARINTLCCTTGYAAIGSATPGKASTRKVDQCGDLLLGYQFMWNDRKPNFWFSPCDEIHPGIIRVPDR